ncbi:MAG: yliI 3, partial [Thermomicrobiales bacterium]|nr:yliI 3 [Thermomicrobiales bacterium]
MSVNSCFGGEFVSPILRLSAYLIALLLVIPLIGQVSSSQAQDATPVAPPAETGPAHLGGDLPGDPQIQLVQVATDLASPVNVAVPDDGSGRIFVVELEGMIRIVNPDGSVEPEPFLDLSHITGDSAADQGLHGLAFHPDFATNGRFFVHYNNMGTQGAIAISEFTLSPDDPNTVDPSSERPLLMIDKPFPPHSGGTLRFGLDGYLYISTGDGGWVGDTYDNAQSRFTLLGKILRIDVDGGDTGRPYGIPADNPFAGPKRYDNPFPGQPPAKAGNEEKEKKRAAKSNPD